MFTPRRSAPVAVDDDHRDREFDRSADLIVADRSGAEKGTPVLFGGHDQPVRFPDTIWSPQHPHINPPAAVAAVIDHRISRLADPVRWMAVAERHWVPTTVACAWLWEGMGWWAHTEPMHPWFTAGFLITGFGGLWMSVRMHHAAVRNNATPDPLMTRGSAAAGMAALVGGAGVGAGFSGISAMLTVAGTAGAGVGRILWLRSRHERAQDTLVEWTAAANPGAPLPTDMLPGAVPLPPTASPRGERLHRAFAMMGIEPIYPSIIHPAGRDAWSVTVKLPGGKMSPDKVIAERATLASNLRCTHLEITRANMQDQVKLTVYDGEDKLAETQPWPGPTTTSFTEPISLGLFENLDPVMQSLLWNHVLIAGATDNGKSGVVNVIVCATLQCRDLVRIGTDCKPGAPELGPYRRVLHHLAEDPISAVATLYGIRAVIDARGKLLAEKSVPSELNEEGIPVRKWRPEFGPFILNIVDELAELSRGFDKKIKDQITEVTESNRQLGRYVGVHEGDATQYPSARGTFGGRSDARQQYQVRIGMRTAEAVANDVIMGRGSHGKGWRLDELLHQGSFMVSSREHTTPRRARSWWISDERIVATVNRYADQIPPLDEMSANAFRDGFDAAYQALSDGKPLPSFTPPPGGGGGRDAAADDISDGPPDAGTGPRLYVVNPADDPADRALWNLLGRLNRKGGYISVTTLVDAAELDDRIEFASLAHVRRKIGEWRDAGLLRSGKVGPAPVYLREDLAFLADEPTAAEA